MNVNIKRTIAGFAMLGVVATGLVMSPQSQWNNCGCDYGKCGCLQITLPPYNPFTPYPTFPALPFPTLQPSSTIIWVITKIPTHVPNATASAIPSATAVFPTVRASATNAPPLPTLTRFNTPALSPFPTVNKTADIPPHRLLRHSQHQPCRQLLLRFRLIRLVQLALQR